MLAIAVVSFIILFMVFPALAKSMTNDMPPASQPGSPSVGCVLLLLCLLLAAVAMAFSVSLQDGFQ